MSPGRTLNQEKLFELPGTSQDTKALIRFDLNLTNEITSSKVFARPVNLLRSAVAEDNSEVSRLRDQFRRERARADDLQNKVEKMD